MALAGGNETDEQGTPAWYWRALSLLILALAVYKISDFPALQNLLVALAAGYAAVLYFRPGLWLVILPGLIPVLGFALWTGRFFFDEFDILIMVTLAAMFWHHGAPLRRHRDFRTRQVRWGIPAVLLLALSYGVSTAVTLWPLPEIDANSFNTYYSPFNALRVAKGFFWALLLFPYLRREMVADSEDTIMRLAQGAGMAMCLLGVVALWERGVFAALLFDRSFYNAVATVLDFSGLYRITGFLADMHVGGAAIDGFIVLALPLAAALVFSGRSLLERVFGVVAVGAGGYAALTTFTRGLYLGLGVAAIVILISVYARHNNFIRSFVPKPARLAVPLVGIILLTFGMFYWGGLASVLLTLFAFSCALFAAIKLRQMPMLLMAGLFVVFLVAAYGNFDSLVESKWRENTTEMALFVALAGSGIAVLVGRIGGGAVIRPLPSLQLLASLAVFVAFVGGTIPALGGVRVFERFSTASEDSDTRIAHWRQSLAMMEQGPESTALGEGVGSFPGAYFAENFGSKDIVSYDLVFYDGRSVLSLGKGDFFFTQKISAAPGRTYKVRITARAATGPVRVNLGICEKHILYSQRWVPSCVSVRAVVRNSEEFQVYEFDLDTGAVGAKGWAYAPPTLQFINESSTATVSLDEISITNERGEELVRNGGFEDGLDGWMFVKDFGHLAWHIKNVYLHVYFEQGLLGALAYVIILVLAITSQWPSLRGKGLPQSSFVLASILAFVATGFFETMLNAPRISWLFLTILMLAVSYGGRPRFAHQSSTSSIPEDPLPSEIGPEPEIEVKLEPQMAEAFIVQFDLEQFEFVHGLASAVGTSPNAAIGSIIEKLESQFGEGAALPTAFKDRLLGAPTPGRMGKAMVGHKLLLSTDHKSFIEALARQSGASPSRVVRLLVDLFVADCRGSG